MFKQFILFISSVVQIIEVVIIRPTPILKRRRSDLPEDTDVIVVDDKGPASKRDRFDNYSDDINIRSS